MKTSLKSGTGAILFLLLIAIAAAGPVQAQTRGDSLTVRGGAIFFDRPEFDTVVLVEFPFTLSRNEFEFYRPDTTSGAYFARIFAQVTLFGADGLPLDSANTYFSAAVARLAHARQPDYTLFNSLVLIIPPGDYSAHLTVIDAVSKKEGRFLYKRIIVDPPYKNTLALGGKCLAYDIKYVGNDPSAAGVGVPKNGYEVRVNPLGTYAVTDTVAFFYAELYNLEYQAELPTDYTMSFNVLSRSGEVLRSLGSKTRPKPGRSAVIVETIDIAGWGPGEYLVQVTASEVGKQHEISYEIPLRIIPPVSTAAEVALSLGHDQGGQANMEIQRCLVHYLLIPEERATMERLSEDGQKRFLDQYWQERDSDVSTEIVENRLQMYERYLYANGMFSVEEGHTDGWSTERGRVLMIYGEPDKKEDRQHPADRHPYEIWHYYSLSEGVVFVFVDEDGFGLYRLMHSTADGELSNKNWDAAIKSGYFEE